MNGHTRRDWRDQRGMTLIELLMAIGILGIISGAIGMSMMVVVKNDSATAGILGNSKSAQALNTWLAADLQSADPATAFDTSPSNTAGCTGGSAFPGVNVLRIALYNSDGVSPSVVSYRVLNGQLVRVTCSTSSPEPRIQVLVDGVASAGDVQVSIDGNPVVDRIRMTVTATLNGQTNTFTIGVSPRGTVPATTQPANPPTGLPCALVGSTTLDPVGLSYDSFNYFRSVVVAGNVQITTTGDCGSELRAEFDTRTGFLAHSETLYPTGGPANWLMNIGTGVAPGAWSTGTKTATISQRAGNSWNLLGTIQFPAVQAPCTYVSGSASGTVTLVGAANNRTVSAGATLTVNLGGVCDGVDARVQFDSRPGNTVTLALNGSGLTRTATVSSGTAAGQWSLSDKTVTVQQDPPGGSWSDFTPVAQFTLVTAADACQFLGGTISPQPLLLTQSGNLTQAAAISVSTTNGCGTQLRARVQTSGNNTLDVTLNPDPTFTTWTANISTNLEQGEWTPGTRTVEVQRRSGNAWVDFTPGASFTYVSQTPTCQVLAHSVVPDPVYLTGSSGSSRSLAAGFRVELTTNSYCGSQMQLDIETRNGGADTIPLTNGGGGTSWYVDVPANFEQGRWSAGTRDVTVQWRNGNSWITINPNPNFTFEAATAPPCTFVSAGIASQPVLLNGSGSSRTVSGSYAATVVTSGFCYDMRLRLAPGGGGTQSLDLSSSNGTTWTATLDSGDFAGQWTATSPKTVTVEYDNGSNWIGFSPARTFQLTVQALPCALDTGSGVSGTVDLNATSSATIIGSRTVTVNTTGDCGNGVRVQFAPGATTQTLSLSPNGSGTSWTALLNSGTFGGQWTSGTKQVTVQYNNGSSWQNLLPAPAFSFNTQLRACYVTNVAQSAQVGLSGTFGSSRSVNTGPINFTVTTTSGCQAFLRMRFQSRSGNTVTIALGTGPTSWQGSIINTTAVSSWSGGDRTVTIEQSATGSSGWTAVDNETFTMDVEN